MRRIGWLTRTVLVGTVDEALGACRELASLDDARAVGPLLMAASQRGGPVAATAIDALVAVGAVMAPALVRRLRRDPDGAALVVLQRLGQLASDAVFAGATGHNRQVRRCCIESLRSNDERWDSVLWAALTDVDCGVRRAAWEALDQRGVVFSVEQLLDFVSGCPHVPSHVGSRLLQPWVGDERVRSLLRSRVAVPHTGSPAAEMLARLGGQELDWLSQQLASLDPIVVRHVARAAERVGHVQFRRAAADVVLDRTRLAEVRAAAVGALARVDENAAAAVAGDAHEPVDVRRACARRLTLAEPRFAELASILLSDTDEQLRGLAIGGGPAEVITPGVLQRAFDDESPFVRRLALWRLLRLDEEPSPEYLDRCLQALRRVVRDSDVSVRASAAELLRWRGDPWAVELLEHLATDPSPQVRQRIERWRSRLRTEPALNDSQQSERDA